MSRLMQVSFDKISNDECGGGGRKNHEIDLRKAVLVTHLIEFLQGMESEQQSLSSGDEDDEDYYEESYQPTTHHPAEPSPTRGSGAETEEDVVADPSAPSASVLQSVVTNSESHTSKYCQYTMPVVCSINTHQKMSSELYTTMKTATSSTSTSSSSTSSSSSSCSKESFSGKVDVIVSEAPEVMCGSCEISPAAFCEVVSTPLSDDDEDGDETDSSSESECVEASEAATRKRRRSSCEGVPLPKKKRPVPVEFLALSGSDDSAEEATLTSRTMSSSDEDDDEDNMSGGGVVKKSARRSSLEDRHHKPTALAPPSMTSATVSTSSGQRAKVATVSVTNCFNYMRSSDMWKSQQQQQSYYQPPHHQQPI